MSREELLHAYSIVVGNAWVERVRLDLRRDDRQPTGGWPGTIREARARTHAHFSDGAVTALSNLTAEEFERVVRLVYEHARGQWLAFAHADAAEDT